MAIDNLLHQRYLECEASAEESSKHQVESITKEDYVCCRQ